MPGGEGAPDAALTHGGGGVGREESGRSYQGGGWKPGKGHFLRALVNTSHAAEKWRNAGLDAPLRALPALVAFAAGLLAK